VKPLSRSGCGPFSGEIVSPRNSPVVASKVSLKLTKPASRERTRPLGSLIFSGSPLKMDENVTVPSPLSVGPVPTN
jgi:hypothetical protein